MIAGLVSLDNTTVEVHPVPGRPLDDDELELYARHLAELPRVPGCDFVLTLNGITPITSFSGSKAALDVASGVACVPPNDLPRVAHAYGQYVVVGAGKTGMDACIWLIENGANPDRIRWIMPRDYWMLDRAGVQPGAGQGAIDR